MESKKTTAERRIEMIKWVRSLTDSQCQDVLALWEQHNKLTEPEWIAAIKAMVASWDCA